MFDTLDWWGLARPGLGPADPSALEPCAELLVVDLATVQALAANVEPYVRVDGPRSGA